MLFFCAVLDGSWSSLISLHTDFKLTCYFNDCLNYQGTGVGNEPWHIALYIALAIHLYKTSDTACATVNVSTLLPLK